jgi:hypothetical protein
VATPRREREKYPRASLGEQLAGELRALRRHPGVLLVALLVVGGGAVLLITRPPVVRVQDLAAGDCLYIRAADASEEPPGSRIGTDGAVVEALYREGAERAGCDASHSHEVIDAWSFEERAVDEYPGAAALRDRSVAACRSAFEAYVGRPADGSAFGFVLAVPSNEYWDDGMRAAACLLERRDGDFLAGPARGSGG